MYCAYCGKEIADTARFCRYCGEAVSEEPEAKIDTSKLVCVLPEGADVKKITQPDSAPEANPVPDPIPTPVPTPTPPTPPAAAPKLWENAALLRRVLGVLLIALAAILPAREKKATPTERPGL